jgi:hypothetical protein
MGWRWQQEWQFSAVMQAIYAHAGNAYLSNLLDQVDVLGCASDQCLEIVGEPVDFDTSLRTAGKGST